jgi:hypothetical protein
MAFKFLYLQPDVQTQKGLTCKKVLALKKKTMEQKKKKKKKKYLTIFSKLLKTELHWITIRNVYGWWGCGNN